MNVSQNERLNSLNLLYHWTKEGLKGHLIVVGKIAKCRNVQKID